MSITAFDISCSTGWFQTYSGIWRSNEYSTMARQEVCHYELMASIETTYLPQWDRQWFSGEG